MSDLVDIKYIGHYKPLSNHFLKISAELVREGRVYPSAQLAILDAMHEIPEFESLELPMNIWNTIQCGDRVFLLDWVVDMKPI